MIEKDDDVNKALANLGVGAVAKDAYADLLKPAAGELGKNILTVARLISHVFAPLEGMVWGMDKIRDWLKVALLKRLSKVEPEKIQTPPLNVAGQILLQLPFCAEQEQERLREMYANLLAAAMDSDRVSNVHPAFVHVIEQITPEEAVILQNIARTRFSLIEKTDEEGRPRGSSISIQFNAFCIGAGIHLDLASTEAYLDNLLRLKIVADQNWSSGRLRAKRNGYWAGGGSMYVETEVSKLIELSAFGQRFVDTCVVEVGSATGKGGG